MRILLRATALLVPWLASCGGASGPEATVGERWACSDELRITVNDTAGAKRHLTTGRSDFKPSWSKTGSMLTFFRQLSAGSGFHTWKTRLCVINVDGSGFRELTSGAYADFNPTWTRDGSNRIVFNRYAVGGSDRNDIYWVDPTGSPADAVRLSDPRYRFEWAFSGLADGRLFIDRIDFSLAPAARGRALRQTPRPGELGGFEEVTRPTTKMWHKLSVSPSETKVAYMLDNDDNMSSYEDVVLYWARFDARTLSVFDPVAITSDDPRTIEEYPRWNADESLIIYDSNRTGEYQMYVYRLEDGSTARISSPGTDAQFGNFENLPK